MKYTMTIDPADPIRSPVECASFQQLLKGLLHGTNPQGVRITFTKVDGSSREMRCTLSEHLIPADKAPKGTGREAAADTARVFDLDKQEWRSFKWAAVTEVEVDDAHR